MSNTIRPKIIEAIKQIASSDSSGNSKARIDTQKEFKALQDYLSGNYEELNATERNSVQRLLDNAKEYLKNTIGNVEQNIENEGKINQKNNEDLTNKKPYETDTSGEQNIENEGKVNQKNNEDLTNKKPYETDTSGEQYIEKEDKVNPNGDDDSTNKKPYETDTSVEQNIGNEDKVNPEDNEDSTNKKPYETDTSVEQNIGNEGKVNPNGDDDSTIKDNQETNAYQQNKIPGKKVIHNGKMCIKTPNGNLYDMQGRRIK